ncbi:MAG: response regulator transcription factor [Alphaproteobacteria bacterium]|nr:response regulator transcription factor [Alphaproteobacteria bacterium]
MQARPQSYAESEARNPAQTQTSPRDHQLQKNAAIIAIGDKNPIVRAGLAEYIARDDRFSVRELVSSGSEFIALCERTRIDVGVIGWGLPDMTGGDVLRAIKRRGLPTRVVVYTGDFSPGVLREAVKSGAWGVTSKADDPSVLIETLASVRAGRMSIPYIDISQLATDPLENLTVREQELMRALAKGWTNEQIASRIGISRNTVKYHLKNLYEKIGASNRAQAVAMYLSSSSNR